MIVHYDASGSADSFQRLAAGLTERTDVMGLMVLSCEANGWLPEALDPILGAMEVPVFGGVFPQIIHHRQNLERGTLVVGLPVRPEVESIHGLSGPATTLGEQVEAVADGWGADLIDSHDTLIVFVDGLGRGISTLVESLFFCFGLERNLLGGGAGSLSFVQRPCVITPSGLKQDAAVIVKLPMRSGVGVAHGWEPISDPMKVTEADRNVIRTLDWRPAFHVYRELVEAHSGKRFHDHDFFDLAKAYPFGINKLGAEVVVRDPFGIADHDGLICVGEVPTGASVKLLSGSPDSLIAAAGRARRLAEESAPFPAGPEHTAFFIDCISRVLYLQDEIEREVEVAAGDRRLFGALTLGEIANSGKDYLEFYNKTAVLALLD
ncbi:MAG: histidine kinase [Gemmatimonadales bacterium]|nr:MAG: histidine kinase [Gemmatimonadales bacterium]